MAVRTTTPGEARACLSYRLAKPCQFFIRLKNHSTMLRFLIVFDVVADGSSAGAPQRPVAAGGVRPGGAQHVGCRTRAAGPCRARRISASNCGRTG